MGLTPLCCATVAVLDCYSITTFGHETSEGWTGRESVHPSLSERSEKVGHLDSAMSAAIFFTLVHDPKWERTVASVGVPGTPSAQSPY